MSLSSAILNLKDIFFTYFWKSISGIIITGQSLKLVNSGLNFSGQFPLVSQTFQSTLSSSFAIEWGRKFSKEHPMPLLWLFHHDVYNEILWLQWGFEPRASRRKIWNRSSWYVNPELILFLLPIDVPKNRQFTSKRNTPPRRHKLIKINNHDIPTKLVVLVNPVMNTIYLYYYLAIAINLL